jgi:hypothetical protein
MNEYFKSLFNLNPINLFGTNTGVNVDDMTMAQKRSLYGSMFDPMEAGRERLRAMTAPDASVGGAAGAALGGQFNPMALLGGLESLGLLNTQQPQFFPMVEQRAMPGLNIQTPSMNNFYGGGLMT